MTEGEGCFFQGLTIAAAIALLVVVAVACIATDALTAVLLLPFAFGD